MPIHPPQLNNELVRTAPWNHCNPMPKPEMFRRKDVYEAVDLLAYAKDHYAAARLLFGQNRGLHYYDSAAYLAHLAIELLLKAVSLHLSDQFQGLHDLERLADLARKDGPAAQFAAVRRRSITSWAATHVYRHSVFASTQEDPNANACRGARFDPTPNVCLEGGVLCTIACRLP